MGLGCCECTTLREEKEEMKLDGLFADGFQDSDVIVNRDESHQTRSDSNASRFAEEKILNNPLLVMTASELTRNGCEYDLTERRIH